MADAYTLKTKDLDALVKAFKGRLPVARVGVYDDRDQRTEGKNKLTFDEIQSMKKPHKANALKNSELGAIHEYGSPSRGIPARSFLRVPIADKLEKELKAANAFTKEALNKVVREGSIESYMKDIAVTAEKIVLGAFASGGYGKWAPWKNSNYTNNANMLLVDTTQLRDSIGSEVVKK